MSDKWYMMSVVTKKMIFTENVKDSDHFFFFQPSMIDNVQDMIKWIFGSITIGRTQKGRTQNGRTQNGRTQKGRKPLSP